MTGNKIKNCEVVRTMCRHRCAASGDTVLFPAEQPLCVLGYHVPDYQKEACKICIVSEATEVKVVDDWEAADKYFAN